MALKVKIACCLGIFTGLLTLFLSFVYEIRTISAIYRGAFTAGLFFAVGYIIGIFTESYFKKLSENDTHKGKNIDISDKADSNIPVGENEAEQAASGTNFQPLNPDDLRSLSPTQE